MDRDRFVLLALAAFGCVVLAFVTLGFGRVLFGYRTGLLLAAPFSVVGFVLVVGLTAYSAWATITGIVGESGREDADERGGEDAEEHGGEDAEEHGGEDAEEHDGEDAEEQDGEDAEEHDGEDAEEHGGEDP